MKNASVGIIRNENNEILLLKRTKEPFGYGLPGGKQEDGETLLENVIREIKEESGLIIKDAILKGNLISHRGNFLVHIFNCTVESYDVVLSSEHTDFIWVSDDKLSSVDLSGNTYKFIQL